MSRSWGILLAAAAWAALSLPGRANAEPMFLSRQYARCTTCHFSPTGGGLLTPYGRSLSQQELSTTGRSPAGHESQTGEDAFLWGILKQRTGPVSLGIDVRPSHLHVDTAGLGFSRDFLMTADFLAAYQAHGWTLYGELGRQPRTSGTKYDSYEYWVAHQSENGVGVRAGRFLPAYGVRLADHTAFTRLPLGLDIYDQVYGLELSYTGEKRLVQVSIGPGRADSILHPDGRRAFTATARYQRDLNPRTVLVASAMSRGTARDVPRNGAGGLAFGFVPLSRLTVWTEADALVQQGPGGPPGFNLLNETSLEVVRGLWLKVSPQLLTQQGISSSGTFRTVFEADLLPRTHWHASVSFYRDVNRLTHLHTKTFLAQLHLYL